MRFLFALIFLPLSVFANQDSALVGAWTLTDLKCSSGAPPNSHFNPGRHDYSGIEFFADNSVTQTEGLNGCRVEVQGTYDIFEQILSLKPYFYNSSCGPVMLPSQVSYSYKMTSDVLELSAPVWSTICPAGDILKSTFKKLN